jgi:beta-galactosidase/beta-glucuronidase
LDGTWQFRLDPADIGSDEAWYSPDAIWNDADELAVPSCWQDHAEYQVYTGTAWYRTTVEYDGSSERVFLRFGAVDYEATVFVDGEKIGTNREGYLPFEMEVTDAVRPGEGGERSSAHATPVGRSGLNRCLAPDSGSG